MFQSLSKSFFILIIIIFSTACEKQKEPAGKTVEVTSYPADLVKVIDLHGGIDHWKFYRFLRFEKDNEVQTFDLWKRFSKIESERYSYGFDGTAVWIQQDSLYFKKSPIFYHNLYFYFYSMPFVLADPGIQYKTAENVTLLGKQYNGIHISYDDGIGSSSKDEYIMYYDPETYQMGWLAYTATFFTKEKKKNFNLIHYEKWEQVRDIWLPAKITWYNYKDHILGEKKNSVEFNNSILTETEFKNFTFEKTNGAKIISE